MTSPTSRRPVALRGEDAQTGGSLFVATGDSITETSSSRANNIWGDSWATYAALASGGRMQHLYTCAKGGYTSAQILRLFDAEVEPLKHKRLVIAVGTNDIDGVTQTLPNIESMIQRSLAKGVKVSLNTVPPAGVQALGPPATMTLTALPGYAGGTLTAGTYYYQVSTRGVTGVSSPTVEQSVTLASTGAVQIDWAPVGGTNGYIVWGRVTGNTKGLIFQNGAGTSQTAPQNRYVDLGTITPGTAISGFLTDTTANNTYTTAVRLKIHQVNQAVHRLADKYGLPVVDQYATLTDYAASGQYRKNYTADGTHPIPRIQKLMGQNVFNTIGSEFPARTPWLSNDRADPTDIFNQYWGDNASDLTGWSLLWPHVGGDTLPWGWAKTGTGGGSNSLAVDGAGNVPGYVLTVNRTDWGGYFINGPSVPSSLNGRTYWTPGDLMSLSYKVKSSGLDSIDSGNIVVGVQAIGSTGATWLDQVNVSADIPATSLPGGWAVWSRQVVVPPGTTALQMFFNVTGAGVSASLAQPSLRNLTRLGLA